jgi:hypothetical protein
MSKKIKLKANIYYQIKNILIKINFSTLIKINPKLYFYIILNLF